MPVAGTPVNVTKHCRCQLGEAEPTEELTTVRTSHHVASAVLLQKQNKTSITQEKNLLRCASALESNRDHLYFSEAVWTELGVGRHPAVTQKTAQPFRQGSVSALQEAFPLLTGTDVVIPQSRQAR